MPQAQFIAVVTTLPGRDEALALGRALVEHRLVACAQVSAIESIYWWDGAVQQAPEFRLLCKTTAALWPAVEAAVAQRRPYTVPAIHACALDQVHTVYGEWIADNMTLPSPD